MSIEIIIDVTIIIITIIISQHNHHFRRRRSHLRRSRQHHHNREDDCTANDPYGTARYISSDILLLLITIIHVEYYYIGINAHRNISD